MGVALFGLAELEVWRAHHESLHVGGWHRQDFRLFWTWKIRRGKPGRRRVPKEVRELIRTMSRDNSLWGAPKIHGELLKLGIESVTTAAIRPEHRANLASPL